jgi:hypothetical protein
VVSAVTPWQRWLVSWSQIVVGTMRRYERDADGVGWHDGLLMDLLAEELDQDP